MKPHVKKRTFNELSPLTSSKVTTVVDPVIPSEFDKISVQDSGIFVEEDDEQDQESTDEQIVIGNGKDSSTLLKEGEEKNDGGKEEEEELSRCCRCWHRSRGIIYGFVAAMTMALSNYIVYVLIHAPHHYKPSFILLARFTILSSLSALLFPLYALKFQERVLDSSWLVRGTVFALGLRSIAGAGLIIFQFYALNTLQPGEFSTIISSNPLVVVVGARIFLHERLSLFQCCAALLALVGVLIIARPPFLMGSTDIDLDYTIGICLALCAMICSAIVNIVLRFLRHVHFLFVNIVFGVVGLVSAIALCGILNTFEAQKNPWVATGGFLAVGLTAFISLTLQTIAVKYEAASVIAVVRCSEVIFSFLFQMASHKYPTLIHFVGATLVISSICLLGFQKYVEELNSESGFRKTMWFILK